MIFYFTILGPSDWRCQDPSHLTQTRRGQLRLAYLIFSRWNIVKCPMLRLSVKHEDQDKTLQECWLIPNTDWGRVRSSHWDGRNTQLHTTSLHQYSNTGCQLFFILQKYQQMGSEWSGRLRYLRGGCLIFLTRHFSWCWGGEPWSEIVMFCWWRDQRDQWVIWLLTSW